MSEILGVTKLDQTTFLKINQAKKTSVDSDFSSLLGESKSMDDIFRRASEKYNVPLDLLKAVGKAESNFNPSAVSRCGAQGVMQLMPATAKGLGVTDSFDAEQNIMGGAKYIASLLKKYDGNTKFAVAAYNAGSGNVAKYNGIPPFKETQNYVKKVIGYYGEGNIEIASSNNTLPATTANKQPASTVTPAPVQNNYSFLLSGSINDGTDATDSLDSLFSYDDYMRFIELFLEDDEDKSAQDEKKEENRSNFTTGEINYNATVMNLLKNQNLL